MYDKRLPRFQFLRTSGYGHWWLDFGNGQTTEIPQHEAKTLIQQGELQIVHHHGPHSVYKPVNWGS